MDILIEKLKSVDVLKYGNFTLKSGLESNYYCDFRILISYPNIIKAIFDLISQQIYENVDLVCGVYFGGIPLANMISFERNIPQIFIRDGGGKKHGTKKEIEGNFQKGQTVLIIEDVITTGQSVIEKVNILEKYELNVKILTILNRNSQDDLDRGYLESSSGIKYAIHSIIPLAKIIENHEPKLKIHRLAFKKKSNIILSVDLNKSDEIIKLIEETRENIIGIKLHSDIIEDFDKLLEYLNACSLKEEFIIIEDCKVADISFISIQKVKNFVKYADYITYHCLLGKDLPISLKNEFPALSLLGIVEMSPKGCLIDPHYMKNTETQLEYMDGCVIQKEGIELLKNLPLTFSPGISLDVVKDAYNQSYKNPLLEKVGEFWIIGRSIYLAKNQKEESEKYKNIGWDYFINFHK